MKREVPFFNYPHVYKQLQDEIVPAMNDVLERGAFILQQEVDEFEEQVGKFVDAKHCVSVANGTLGTKRVGLIALLRISFMSKLTTSSGFIGMQ